MWWAPKLSANNGERKKRYIWHCGKLSKNSRLFCSVNDANLISGCSLFYQRELRAHSTKSLKISGWKKWCPKNLQFCASMLTHSLPMRWNCSIHRRFLYQNHCIRFNWQENQNNASARSEELFTIPALRDICHYFASIATDLAFSHPNSIKCHK